MPRPTRNQIELAAVTMLGFSTLMCMGLLVAYRTTPDSNGQERRRLTLRGTEIHDFLTGRSQQDMNKDTGLSRDEVTKRKEET